MIAIIITVVITIIIIITITITTIIIDWELGINHSIWLRKTQIQA